MPTTQTNIAEGIRALLIAANLDAYIIDAPAEGNVISVVPYASDITGNSPVGTQFFQIRAAATTFPQSEANAWIAFQNLNGKIPGNVDRDIVGTIRALQEPFFLKKSEDGSRYIHVFNAAVSAVKK